MEKRVDELLAEFKVEAEGADRYGLVAQLALRVVQAEQELERHSHELIGATEGAVVGAKAGELRTSVRGDLLAAVSGKAAAVDAAMMKVAERREALAIVAEGVKAAREAKPEEKPLPELAEKDQVRWDALWEPTRRHGEVMQVRDGMVWVQESGADTVWVMGVERVEKVEPGTAMDHADCRGFDNQEFYWHCYTHEVYNQSF
ncbi:hypothetical protein [Micromonospora sp. NPDC050495]|uniref:hypothetical protein n=1 Tax=Micromonospora sp. NPDC050495 TaxID=3154936 RepID=UPI0033D3D10B